MRPSPLPDEAEREYRARLQRALGDGYELREQLGQGGMGAVYVARDLRLDRDVAVKTLRHDVFPSHVVLERFEREARALARLRHPNILPVFAVGDGDGLVYMITPRIDGSSASELLVRQGAIPWEAAVRIGAHVARALEAAHRVGIIHRDVKPDNILIEGDERHALLADFGIAKGASDDAALTASGMLVGSPRYMSPEQLDGSATVDERTDVYALGATLYEMIAGRPAFDGPTIQRVIVQKMTEHPPPLAAVATLPQAVSDAIMKCLAREREERWPSAGALADALDAVAAPTVSSAAVRPSWFARRAPLLYATIVLFTLLEAASGLLAAALNPLASFVLSAIIEPIVVVLGVLVALSLVEALVLARRRGALADIFGQPRWWLAWYPASLRHPRTAWNSATRTDKAMRTLLFAELAVLPVALALLYVVPALVGVASGVGMPLALPLRVMIATTKLAKVPLEIGLVVIAGWFAVLASRTSARDVIRRLVEP